MSANEIIFFDEIKFQGDDVFLKGHIEKNGEKIKKFLSAEVDDKEIYLEVTI